MRFSDPIVIAVFVLGAESAYAADPVSEPTGGYVGGSLGASSASLDSASTVYPNTLIDPYVERRKGDVAWQLNAGYRFNKYLAVEAGGGVLGQFSVIDSVGPDSIENRLKADDLKLDLIGHLPLSDRFDLSAGVGVARVYTRSEAILSGSTSLPTGEASEHSLTQSVLHERVGVEYALTNHWSLKLDFEHYGHLDSGATSQTTGISAINTLSVGGDYHF
jgi:opacity protein-like surface antigen